MLRAAPAAEAPGAAHARGCRRFRCILIYSETAGAESASEAGARVGGCPRERAGAGGAPAYMHRYMHRSRRRSERGRARLPALALLAVGAGPGALHAESVTVAVAANFVTPLEALEVEFEAATPHDLTIVAASTGQLYAQIVNGAPFDVLLAGDVERPRLLAEQGAGDPGSRFTYAIGRLALWTRAPALREGLSLETLGRDDFRWLAIANPEVAPYGLAAQQTLESLGLWEALQPRLVRGQNIGQAFVMAESGNAELGLVALSQALAHDGPSAYVTVPPERYAPVRQDAIVLERARGNAAAAAFVEFLRAPAAKAVIERFGYDVPWP